MTDIRTAWEPFAFRGDWLIEPPALGEGADLETAVLISLFSDARADDDDRLPGSADDKRGWWAGPIGSRLWLLTREKSTNDVRLRARDYCREALAWMIEDQVADQIDVSAEWAGKINDRLDIEVAIYRDGKEILRRRYDWTWRQAQRTALIGRAA
ncbi:MAG: phage GP46 family protein [Alphaproteobacteria bacterium]|nr:phage GP46 family protein [Alphaproteobacteria bacterium]